MTLVDLRGDFCYFCLKISVATFPVSDRTSRRSKERWRRRWRWFTLEGHSRYYNRFRCLYNVRSELQQPDVIREHLYLLSYLSAMTVIWRWARHVSDS